MNNKGQTTILFSLCIGILCLFTLTALEIGRIYLSKVKIVPCVHSMHSSIMADYNEELFERYHLLFLDVTYGTGSEAVIEEKMEDYLETSLNGQGNTLYQYEVEEIGIADKQTVLSQDMLLLKKQIADYEKTAGLVNRAKNLAGRLKNDKSDMGRALWETETNAVELDLPQTEEQDSALEEEDVKDPRKELEKFLELGILTFVASDMEISKEKLSFEKNYPSQKYEEQKEKEWSNRFDDIGNLKDFLKSSVEQNETNVLTQHATFTNYVIAHFSNGVHGKNDTVMQCEVEYILEGKDNDYDNMEAVVTEMLWLRMPVNYAYLLTDTEKQSQALTLATAICAVTGTEPFIEIVKYLLLGCWSYGESLHEMKLLLKGASIPYVKTKQNWYTDLQTLSAVNIVEQTERGLSYEDYLMILLAKKSGTSLNMGYARILDIIEKNIQKDYKTFRITDCVGSVKLQGQIRANRFFSNEGDDDLYKYYFEEELSYQ